MARVYLETSFVSACVTQRDDPGSVHRKQVSLEWWATQRAPYEIVVSGEVLLELSDPGYPQREDALAFVRGLTILSLTAEVTGLAEILIRERVMPGPLAGDAVHVAVATIHRAEYMLSWNVRHLANPNKVRHLSKSASALGSFRLRS